MMGQNWNKDFSETDEQDSFFPDYNDTITVMQEH